MHRHYSSSHITLLADLASGALILLFLYTAVSKLSDFTAFAETLEAAPLIGRFAIFLRWLLPAVEIGIAILLCIPALRLKGMYASLVLLLLFTLYLAGVMALTHLSLPCSCGGVLRHMSWKQHIAFNSLFILLNAIGIGCMMLSSEAPKPRYARD